MEVKALTRYLVNFIKAVVGDRLSQVKGENGMEPAVIQGYQNGHRPGWPYITVYPIGVEENYGTTLYESIPNEDGEPETGVVLSIGWTIRCESEDGSDIDTLRILKNAFKQQSVLSGLRTDGLVLNDISGILVLPKMLGDKNYVDGSEIILTLDVLDYFSDSASGWFDTINLDGELLVCGEDTPLEMDIHVPLREPEPPPQPEPEPEKYPPIPPEELEYDGYYTLTLTTKFLQVPTLDENYPPAENKIWGIGTHTEPEITIISVDGDIPGTLTKAEKILTDNIFNEPDVDLPIHHFDFMWAVYHLPGASYARSIAIRQTAESSTLGVTIVGIQANDDYVTEDNTNNWSDYFGDPYAGYDTFHVEGLTLFGPDNLPEELSEPDEPITVRVYYKNE